MPRERTPRPTDLMGARQISEEWGLPLRTAENLFQKIARAHGGPVVPLDPDGRPLVRRIFVRRAWVESSIGPTESLISHVN